MIDFEQLKIENQTLNEKIEERNEELTKLKRKKTTTVQILTHVREKLKFVEHENNIMSNELINIDTQILTTRNSVTMLKLTRDDIRNENKDLKAKQSFATNDILLADFNTRKIKNEQLQASIDELKERYKILTKQINQSKTASLSKHIFGTNNNNFNNNSGGGNVMNNSNNNNQTNVSFLNNNQKLSS